MGEKNIKPFMMVFNTKGIDEKSGIFSTQPNCAEWVENMHTDQLGVFSAHKQGYEFIGNTLYSGKSIDGLSYYRSLAGLESLLAVSDGNIAQVSLSGVFTQTLQTGLSIGLPVDFEVLNGNIYACQEAINPLKWTGTGSMSAVIGFPITLSGQTYEKPALIERHVNRMVYADFHGTTRYPSHLAISDFLDAETFTVGLNDTNAAIVEVSPGDGQKIAGLKSMNIPSSNETVLLIFKESSVFVLSGDTPTNFNIDLLNGSIGALNNRCIVQVGNEILFLDRHRINALSTANESGTIRYRAIESDRIQKSLKELNLSAASQCFAVHLPARQEVWFGIPTGASQQVNRILVYRYALLEDEPSAWSVRSSISACAPVVTPDDKLIMGNYSGRLLKFFETSLYDTSPMNWRYRYPYYSFGAQPNNKRIVECYAWFYLSTPTTVNFKTDWRGGGANTSYSFSKLLTPKFGATYGTNIPPAAIYGQGFYNDIPLLKVKIPVWGNGEQLRFEVSGVTSSSGGPIFLGLTGLVEFMNYSRSYQ